MKNTYANCVLFYGGYVMKSLRSVAKRPVRDSALYLQTRKVRYEYLNSLGTMHGGDIYKIMDEVAACVAENHSGKPCVTRWDEGGYVRSVLPADTLVIEAYITRAWKTSMEIGVQVYKAEFRGHIRLLHLVAIRQYVFVALNQNAEPIVVPGVVAKTGREKMRFRLAAKRRKLRLALGTLQDPLLRRV